MSTAVFRYLTICLLLIPVQLDAQEDSEPAAATAEIQNCRSGAAIDMAELVADLAGVDVVFLGEQHDNDSGHELQLQVIQGLVEAGHSVAISTEQFERDVQGALNDYLAGRIEESRFLEDSRPWKNYQKHYRPIVEFAKANQLPVLAANIPRRVARAVSQGKNPSTSDQSFVPRHSTAPGDAYWHNFKATMEGHMGTEGDEQLKQFYASQCFKDDAMAESIADYLAANSHERKIVVHLCGHFHSDYGLGTVARVAQRRPLARFAVVTMELVENKDDEQKQSELANRAHYVFWTVPNQKSDD